jgi:two-component system, LytTR family, response regulator
MTLRMAVLDDEPLAVEVLADYVQKTEGLILTEATGDVFKVLELAQKKAFDILLLDIQMPELTGIQVMKIIGNGCKVILTTAYTEYALDSYDFNVTDYLLKPIAYDRFLKAIEKAKPAVEKDRSTTVHAIVPVNYIFVKSEYKLIRVNLDDILYIEALRDYIAIHTTGQEKIMSLESLKNMEDILPATHFMRVHKSFVVAINKIAFVERSRIVINKQYIPVGESYQAKFVGRIRPQ